MSSLNLVLLIGNLGGEVEMRYTPGGKAVAVFQLATNETFKNPDTGEKENTTEWHTVVTWGKTAENCNQYVSKGSKVFVRGKNRTRSWDDKEGNRHWKTEVIASRVTFLDKMPVPEDSGKVEKS